MRNFGVSGKTASRLAILLLSAALAACASAPAAPGAADAAVMTQARQAQISPDQALQMLRQGNARFASGQPRRHDLSTQVKVSGHEGQFPFASIVSCIDSRADPALVFDQGIGDIFSARVAGNIVNPDILGSLEYASKVAGSKLIVILGHTHCGAVKGACDAAELGNLTQLLQRIRAAVDATPDTHGADRSSSNHHFVDAVAATNVGMTVKAVLDGSPILAEMAAKGQVRVVGAMLDVETGQVEFD